eukprot:3362140-Pleurochrysis_carterae.AAC.6
MGEDGRKEVDWIEPDRSAVDGMKGNKHPAATVCIATKCAFATHACPMTSVCKIWSAHAAVAAASSPRPVLSLLQLSPRATKQARARKHA